MTSDDRLLAISADYAGQAAGITNQATLAAIIRCACREYAIALAEERLARIREQEAAIEKDGA